VGQKHSKVARLRMAPDPTQDPEKEKLELLKQTSKSRSKRQKTEDDGFGNPRAKRKSHPRKRGGDGVWSDDEDAAYDMYGAESDEDHDLDSGPSPRRRASRKGGTRSSADARKEGKYQTDDFVVSDSPSDDGDSESGKRSKRKVADKGQSDDDDLDKLEAKIEQQEEAERKMEKGDVEEDGHPEPEEMDVESEEPDEDDEHQVRKTSGKRRRLAANYDEEEE
jgi:RNA polymerase-associated protein LEO1